MVCDGSAASLTGGRATSLFSGTRWHFLRVIVKRTNGFVPYDLKVVSGGILIKNSKYYEWSQSGRTSGRRPLVMMCDRS